MSFCIKKIILKLQYFANLNSHRCLLIIAGEKKTCYRRAKEVFTCFPENAGLWIGEPMEGIPSVSGFNQVHDYLGREKKLIIFDGFSGIDVDSLGIVSGLVQAGGIFVLLLSNVARLSELQNIKHGRLDISAVTEKNNLNNRYLNRLSRIIKTFGRLTLMVDDKLVRQEEFLSFPKKQAEKDDYTHCYISKEQLTVVMSVQKVVHGHRRRPMVLTADRGRGKSAALGIAAAMLMKDEKRIHISVTASRRAAVQILFHHAESKLHELCNSAGELHFNEGVMQFYTPNQLISDDISCRLLLVDEAAAIPIYLLKQLLVKYSRVVFSSTVHGYEGTGRGFSVKFFNILNQSTPNWKHIKMYEPVRWASGDPLEFFTSEALLLNANPVDSEKLSNFELAYSTFQELDRNTLILEDQDYLLKELFGLLVYAHYKTTPSDLRYMLDGGNVRIFVMRFQKHIIGAAIVAVEGGLCDELAILIKNGKRRVKGHIFPQSLAMHMGLSNAVKLKVGRVMRVAVHPAVQRCGVGSFLLKEIIRTLKDEGLDYIGSTFGIEVELLDFWHANGFYPVRIGLTKDKSSGIRSVMMMRGLSVAGEELFKQVYMYFNANMFWLFGEAMQDLDSAIILRIVSSSRAANITEISADNWRVFSDFALGKCWYEDGISAIKNIVFSCCANRQWMESLTQLHRHLLIAKVIQNTPWERLLKQNGKYIGNAVALKHLRAACLELRHLVCEYILKNNLEEKL